MRVLQWSLPALCAAMMLGTMALAPSSNDPVYTRFLGAWTCNTVNGSHVDMIVTVAPHDILMIHAPYHHDTINGWTDQRIVHGANGTWTATYTNSSNGTFSGTSSGFADGKIAFTGVQKSAKNVDDTSRETFTFSDDGAKLEHKWELQTSGGAWLLVSTSRCDILYR